MLRFADIHKDKVAFVHAGDIYIAPTQGGQASQLTSGTGLELFPKFSPDGKYIAFSAEYSGNRQVYVMTAKGDNLRQLTFYNDVGKMAPRGGFDYRILDWTPDGKQVLVRANRLPWGRRMGRPLLVPVDGGMPQTLAVPESGGGMLSPDGNTFLYTPIDREFRTWKRYRGGRAQDVWTYNLASNQSQQLTKYPGTDQHPTWVGGNIYFVSDRDYTLNLYRYRAGSSPEKVTHHKDFDVLWASAGPQAIVYENGGYLYRFAANSNTTEKLHITVPGVRPHTRASFKNVAATIEAYDISHDGKRALISARGELFTLPQKHGPIRNITRTPGIREMSASWSPDGKQVLYLSDATGEYEIYIRDQQGSSEPQQITQGNRLWKYPPVWSADSKQVAWSNKQQTLWVKKLGKKAVKVDSSRVNDISDYRFSPDGAYLAYVKQAKNGLSQIWLYDIKQKRSRQLSDGSTADWSPVFDPQGRYLYFLSNRDFQLTFSDREFNYLYNRSGRIYAAPLHSAVKMPGTIHSDEVGAANNPAEKKGEKGKKKNKPALKAITLNSEVMRQQTVALSAAAGSYRALSALEDGVLVIDTTNSAGGVLKKIAIDHEAKIDTIAEKIDGYRLAAGGKKLLVKQKEHFSIIDIKPKQKLAELRLDMSNLQLRVDPKLEWPQMYTDAWRVLRDWFYDANLHGNDWQAIYDKYRPLVDYISHRSDLDYILGEIAGELNAGHIYVQSGDEPSVKRIEGGLLGADILPHASGYFQVGKLFASENWHPDFRSPLTSAGVKVAEGEFIIAVNGVSTRSVKNFYQLMENTANKITTLSVSPNANGKPARDILLKPIARETNLRYLTWVKERAAYVEKLSGGRIGYIHLPNTQVPGNRELFKQFLPQVNKEALIIDDRYNGGGFIPDRMIELLARKPLNYWKSRGLAPQATPFYHHNGPKVMLVNGNSGSGGDALPYYFRKLGLGKIIGTRTWGGLIGISGNPGLVDGGQVLAATFRFLDTDGEWAVENEGVTPDIEVIDRPELIAQGKDPSIERAVDELLKQLPATPAKPIQAPAAPSDFR
ncbi:MAG: PDZ domain-containing protein [Cellvibrionaceae bacterium]|nr:PDZ domain-containing protein [Cellvibrionaceae bacterium]